MKFAATTLIILSPFVRLCPAAEAELAAALRLKKLSVEELFNLDVTSVTRQESTLARSPAAVSVITQEDIRRSGATLIPELFRTVPGMDVARLDNNKWAISSRGFNQRFFGKMLVQFDGRTLYNPFTSGVYWDAVDYPLEDIDRIEVIRGPRAGVWGANAVNDLLASGARGRRMLVAGAFSFLSLFAPAVVPAQSPKRAFNELAVKIVFLFNFTQFVEWPPGAFTDTQAPLVIGILGKDPFGRTLDQVVRGEKARNREIIVERYQRVEDVKQCHLLFISASEGRDYERIVGALERRPILTVGEADEFARRGGMMRFLTENNRLRLRVNLKAAQRAGLSISSNLLRSAEIVESEATR